MDVGLRPLLQATFGRLKKAANAKKFVSKPGVLRGCGQNKTGIDEMLSIR
jgi:hypothetical protein